MATIHFIFALHLSRKNTILPGKKKKKVSIQNNMNDVLHTAAHIKPTYSVLVYVICH